MALNGTYTFKLTSGGFGVAVDEGGNELYWQGVIAAKNDVVILDENGQEERLSLDDIDGAGSTPAFDEVALGVAGTADFLKTNFFLPVGSGSESEGFNLQQYMLDTGYTPEFQSGIQAAYEQGTNIGANVRAYPFFVEKGINLNQLLVFVTQTTGNTALAAVYESGLVQSPGDVNVPAKKLFDLTNIDFSVAGTQVLKNEVAGFFLPAGVYWFVLIGTTTQGRLRSIDESKAKKLWPSGFSGPGGGVVWRMDQSWTFAQGLPEDWATAGPAGAPSPWTNKVTTGGKVPLLFARKNI